MVVNNAITDAFRRGGALRERWTPEQADRMLANMLAHNPLDKETDAPMPEWAVKLLMCPFVGYKTRIKICLSHHEDITGTTIKTHLHYKDIADLGSKAKRLANEIHMKEIENG